MTGVQHKTRVPDWSNDRMSLAGRKLKDGGKGPTTNNYDSTSNSRCVGSASGQQRTAGRGLGQQRRRRHAVDHGRPN